MVSHQPCSYMYMWWILLLCRIYNQSAFYHVVLSLRRICNEDSRCVRSTTYLLLLAFSLDGPKTVSGLLLVFLVLYTSFIKDLYITFNIYWLRQNSCSGSFRWTESLEVQFLMQIYISFTPCKTSQLFSSSFYLYLPKEFLRKSMSRIVTPRSVSNNHSEKHIQTRNFFLYKSYL